MEAGWFKSDSGCRLIGEMPVIVCLSFSWRYVADGLQQPVVVEPGHPDNEAFNEFWDETFGEFTMRDYSFSASEILFALDLPAYEQERKWHAEEEEEEEDDDDEAEPKPSGSNV